MAIRPQDIGLLQNQPFRRLVESRAVGQIAQNALLYSLLILVVNKTESSIQTTLLVVAFILPSIVLGIPAGALAEVLPRRALLTLGYVLRAAAVGAILLYRHDLWRVYLLVLGFSTVGQFTGPAESAALPRMVRSEQVATANSFFVLSVMVGQVTGGVVLAPLLLKSLGVEVVLGVAAALFLAAAVVVSRVAGLQGRQNGSQEGGRLSLGRALAEGWRVLRSSRHAFMAMVYLTIAGTLAKSLAVLAPHYTRDVLRIEAENTVFVVAPAAIGAIAALVLAPLLTRLLGASRTTVFGFFLLVLGLISLGLVVYVRDFMLDHVDLGISFVEERVGVSSVITVAMIIAIPVGFAATVVGVAGKAVLNQEAAEGTQARVFATQSALSDALSLVPLFIVGVVADLVGVRSVLLAAALAGLAVAMYLNLLGRLTPTASGAGGTTPAG
jgi:MFS family permease